MAVNKLAGTLNRFSNKLDTLQAKQQAKRNMRNALRSGDAMAIQQANEQYTNPDINPTTGKPWNNSSNEDRYKEGMPVQNPDINPTTGKPWNGSSNEDRYKGGMPVRDKNEETPSDKPESKGSKKRGWQFSDTFYRDATASLTGRPTGNRQDIRAATLDQQMRQKQNEAATHDKDAQYHKQIGQRNEYEMAEKDRANVDDSTNRGKINQTNFSAGTASAALRTTSTADVQGARDYKDRNMQIGEQRADLADTNREDAIEAGGSSKEWRLGSRDYDNDLNKSGWLSRGGDGSSQTAPRPAEQPEQPEPTQSKQEEQPEQEQPDIAQYNTDWQDVLNYITFGNDPSSGWSNDQKDGGAARQFAEANGWKPVTMSQAEWNAEGPGAEGRRQQIVAEQNPAFYKAWQEGSKRFDASGNQTNVGDNGATVQQFHEQSKINEYECGTGNAKPGYAIVGEEGPELVKMKGGEQVIPTSDTEKILCDMRMKFIREDLDEGRGLQDYDLNWLLKQMGSKYEHEGQEYDYDSDDGWTEDILKGYADHIKNYIYNYKPEAQSIDSRIDPNEEHIGPMAQDIEQVNPACVKENEDGVKMVDSSRLAMMNAGAIGDLARKLDEVLDRLDRLEGAR